MPYSRPGPGVYVRNGSSSTLEHGQTVVNSNFVGVAVKQRQRGWRDGYDVQATIARDEQFFIITKGVIQVTDPGLSSPAKGDAVYITAATNVITKTASGNVPFGRVVEVTRERGTPAGKLRIDLDAKDSVVAA